MPYFAYPPPARRWRNGSDRTQKLVGVQGEPRKRDPRVVPQIPKTKFLPSEAKNRPISHGFIAFSRTTLCKKTFRAEVVRANAIHPRLLHFPTRKGVAPFRSRASVGIFDIFSTACGLRWPKIISSSNEATSRHFPRIFRPQRLRETKRRQAALGPFDSNASIARISASLVGNTRKVEPRTHRT